MKRLRESCSTGSLPVWAKMHGQDARVTERLLLALILLLALTPFALAQDAAPDREFDRIADHVAKDVPSQDLVDRIYEFMEKYPKDPRSDRLQYWAGIVQQKRKFHNEAIKEFGYLVKDFPKSP